MDSSFLNDQKLGVHRRHYSALRLAVAAMMLLVGAAAPVTLSGCSDDLKTVRSIQAGRQARQQAETQIDHLGEAFSLVSRLIELQPDSANRQIIYHLNAWQQATAAASDTQSAASDDVVPVDLLKTVSDIIPLQHATEEISRELFGPGDVEYLKYQYLLGQVADWVRTSGPTDTLWESWLKRKRETLGPETADQLAVAIQLFDWTVRNIALEPLVLFDPAPPAPRLPLGMQFRGAGYRQTPIQTLFRGTGDALQRSGTFIGLCRHAELAACLLATGPAASSGQGTGDAADDPAAVRPWLVGVLVGGEVYLFDCGLGVPVVGPNQVGIATLNEARRDASVLRRMNVPGWFDYPLQKDDVQQCQALLMLEPEGMSFRVKRMQQALTGDLRMAVYDDPVGLAESFEAVAGIATARIWDIPLRSRIYKTTIAQASEQDPLLSFYVSAPWAILEADVQQSRSLALGRWRHLQGRFDSDDDEGVQGAKKLYLSQRQPEFEIADLRIDVDLQMQYGIRRELGVSPEFYDQQIQQVQALMRQGKITATYWLSLIQYDIQRMDLARTWFEDRILDDGFDSQWEVAARYNLARVLEQLGDQERSAELYRVEGDPQEHGNRIRARLIQRGQDQSS